MMQGPSGVFCAFWIPTDAGGEVIWPALEKHLEWVLNSGAHGIMALGSTGEFVHLTLAQRQAILEKTVQACRRRDLPVIANISDVQHRNAIELGRHARSAGAAIAAVLPPWYYPMSIADQAEFFIRVGRETELPLLLYNYPEVTGKKIELETIERVARAVPVVAVKQSGADFEYHRALVGLAAKLKFSVLTGSDTRLAEALGLGCAGAVSGLANALPEVFAKIYANCQRGVPSLAETDRVLSIAKEIAPLQYPLNVKAVIAARGFETGAPKSPMSPETESTYESVVRKLRSFF